jgi:hypothetical protein
MREPRSYIVRVYRQGFRTLTGIVEDTRSSAKRPFRSAEDLLALLRRPIARPASAERRRKTRSTDQVRRKG